MDETNGYQPIAETTERYLRFLRALVRSWPTPISSDRIHLQTITLNVAHNHIIDSSTSSSFGHHASMGLLDQATWTKATSPNSSVFLRANSDVRGSCQVGGAWVNFNLVEWGSFSWSAQIEWHLCAHSMFLDLDSLNPKNPCLWNYLGCVSQTSGLGKKNMFFCSYPLVN